MLWDGPWNSGMLYPVGSVVSYGGAVYIATEANTGATPGSSTVWQVLGGGGGSGISEVKGTGGRISVTDGTTIPKVDIDAAYPGQTSIITLGTITTGVWNGTPVTVPYGGSGATSLTGYLKGNGTSPFTAVSTIPTSDLSGTVTIPQGGTGQTTANAALNALLPSQGGNAGKVLTTDGTNTSWVATGGTGTVTSVGISSSDMSVSGSPITGAGTITLALNTVPATKGGTGQSTYATGDTLYASAANTLSKLSIGTVGQIYAVSAFGIPEWSNAVTAMHGGTSQTSYAQGDMLYASAANTLAKLPIAASGYVMVVTGGNIPGWVSKLGPLNGGTDQTSWAQGDLLYASFTHTLAKLGIGTAGQVLTVGGGNVPVWAAPSISGTAGGDLSGSYPNPTVSKINTVALGSTTATSGNLLVADGSSWVTKSVSGDLTLAATGAATIANSAVTLAKMADLATQQFIGRNTAGTGVPESLSMSTARTMLSINNVENTALSTWAGSTNLTTLGTITTGVWNGTAIGISKGGTGQATQTAGFNALSPLTTKGDLIGFDTGNNVRIPVGTNGYILTADSTATGGFKWAPASITSPVTVPDGGTGVTTFTAGVVVSPGGATALTTVTGTDGVFPKWSSSSLAASSLSESTDRLIYAGAGLQTKSQEVYSSSPLAFHEFRGQYNSGASLATMAKMQMGKENATDGNDAGYWSVYTKSNGGALAERLRVTSTGLVNIPGLTVSRPVYTDSSGNLVSQTVAIADGGSGQTTANAALNAFLPSQGGNSGKVLSTDGSNTSWISVGTGSVTSVSVVTANGVSGTVANATTTPAITLTLGAITPTSVISVAALTLGTSAGNANVIIAPNGTGKIAFGTVGNGIEILQGTGASALTFQLTDARTSYLSAITPAIYASAGGGSGPFSTAGGLIIQPRTTASRDLTFAVYDGSSIIRAAAFTSAGNLLVGDTITGVNLTGGGGLAVQSSTAYGSEAGAIFTNGGISAIKGIFLGRTNATLGTIRMAGSTSGYCQIQPSAAAGSWTMTLPTGAGTSGYVLSTDGTGVTSWVAQSGGGGTVTGVTATSPLSSSGGTAPDISLGTVPETKGGTNQTTYTTGDTLYASGSNTLSKRAIGTTGQVLTVSGGVPTWATPSAAPTATSSFVQTGSADYTLVATGFTDVSFGGSDFKITLPSTGTYLVIAILEITGSPSDETIYAQFTKSSVAVANSERRVQRVAVSDGNPQQLVMQNLITSSGSEVVNVQAYVSNATYDHKIGYVRSTISYVKLS